MKEPDKIYIHTRTEPYCSITWSEVKEKNCTNEEYIRKEALIEWLESKVYEHNEDRFDDGFNAALGQVIDKLNSMQDMSKRAEEAVIKAYPINSTSHIMDLYCRKAYQKGYEQAEKDFTLTVNDLEYLLEIVDTEKWAHSNWTLDAIYEEALRQFNETR